ncbi:hypothetical protein UFOVP724_166 [uncultured Caudovirales phage]|uniref:Uncharacterized protein n=1 Tax=uncultured Caudovirales phage TaxID=2100421 RepID=A0A6J5NYS7_9CAUD|nr:hypothetical protein UFOVP724_166 [uncultured Caudovirales phage]
MDNFSYSYFSGANISVIINVDSQDVYIDCAGLSYSVNYGSSPIYSYCSELFDAVLRGREMVQGNFILNHTSAKLISELLNDAWNEELGINFLNARTFDFIIKFTNQEKENIILKDAAIISRSQTIQIDSINILEEYSFVAKEMTFSTALVGKRYLDIKKEKLKKQRKPFMEEDLYKTIEIEKVASNSNFLIKKLNDAVTNIDLTVKRPYISGEGVTVYAKDGVAYTIKRPADVTGFDKDPGTVEKTKSFLQDLYFKNIGSDENKKTDLKKQLAYMLSKERGNSKNNNNREALTDDELNAEKAALLWTATNRLFIRKDKMDFDNDVSEYENDLLINIFNNSGWASYYQDYKDGKYEKVKRDHIDFVDKFLNGEFTNQIYAHTNFVHANDNLNSFPKWSLGADQNNGQSVLEPVYIGNAVFSTGYQLQTVNKLRKAYKDLYPLLYNDENKFTIPYEERE